MLPAMMITSIFKLGEGNYASGGVKTELSVILTITSLKSPSDESSDVIVTDIPPSTRVCLIWVLSASYAVQS